jgi:hypothetical protein
VLGRAHRGAEPRAARAHHHHIKVVIHHRVATASLARQPARARRARAETSADRRLSARATARPASSLNILTTCLRACVPGELLLTENILSL